MPTVPSAAILPFRRAAPPHVLTTKDRIEALQWAAQTVEAGVRLAFHRCLDGEAAEAGDYISIYCGGGVWAAWGVARRGQLVNIWRCATGADLGHFPTMREALAALGFSVRRQAKEARSDDPIPALGAACRTTSPQAPAG